MDKTTGTIMDLHAMITAELDTGERDVNVITTTVLDAALESSDRFKILYPAVAEIVRMAARQRVRRRERNSASWNDRPPAGEWINPAMLERKLLLDELVSVPGKGNIMWGDMNIADHEAVIQRLETMAGAINDRIARHRSAVDAIREHGVSCLRQIADIAVI
jgi:hypothetical protein